MNTEHPKPAFEPWTDSALWQEIKRHAADGHPARQLLEQVMLQVERVLLSGGSSPKDFTLHDAGHGFRVAKWMVELVPQESLQGTSPAELALLLLSAYLHDVGMTPE